MVRYRALIPLLIAAFVLIVPAGMQASTGPAAAGPAADAERASERIAQRGKGKKRPGCRRFCQQAGGFGACTGSEEFCNPVEIPAQRVGGTRDGIVAIRATCTLEYDCVGAILLNSFKGNFDPPSNNEYGRADLKIPAGETKKVKVGIRKKGLKYLKENGGDKSAYATVPLVTNDPAAISGDINLLKP